MTSSLSDLRQSPAEEVVFFPASFAQQRLWFIDQLIPGKATYNIPGALRIRGKLDVDVLEKALQEIARRHETLRTRFVAVRGEPQQVIEDQVNVRLQILDLTGIAGEEEREAEAMRLAREEAQQPFDLQQAPLMRGKLLWLGGLNHVLLFTMHHIISDAWSMGVLIGEVSVLYDVFSGGRSSPLPELPIQYADYTVWQRECLEGGMLERQLAYWKQQLAGVSMLQLATDRPRPTSQSQRGTVCEFVIEVNVTSQLKKLAQEQGATLFMVLLAAFQALLCRYTCQYDIAVGTPIAGRSSSDTERLIGFFVNTLVLRVDLSGTPSFIELLQRVRKVTLEAYAHQDISFEKLVEVISPERNLGSTPLFQVMIGLQNAPQSDLRLGAAELQPFSNFDNGTSKFDLLLQLGEDGTGKLAAALQYNTDLFAAASIGRMIDHYRALLTSIVTNPSQSIDVLPLMAANERKQVIEEWNRTTVEFPRRKCLPGLIEEQAARTPEAMAVEYETVQLRYHELNARANQLAWRLKELGVGPETRVGVMVERSLEMVIGLLGVLKAGAAYVPLDPDYPPERLSYMFESSQVKVLLTQQRLRQQLSHVAGPVLVLDGAEEQRRITEQKTENPDVNLLPENLAYIIHTSGSTGRPKGVMNTHGGLLNRLLWMQEEYRLKSEDVVLQKTPFSFDVSVWEFFWPLMEGAKLVVARPGGHQDPGYLAALIEEQQITTLHFVPSMLAVFLDEERLKQCRSLRRVVCSGEVLPAELARRCLAGMPWAELHNLYGPTEAAIDVTYWKCMAEDSHSSVPIGKPIANIRVYVVDEGMEAVPVGVPGELCLAGVGLARGYWDRGDLTAEMFVPDGLSGRSGERLYRTGDLARWLEDGNLEFLGRADHQVKIRGFRVELGEIEAALEEHDSVRQAVVIAREDTTGEKRLVAYVVIEAVDNNNDQQSTEWLWMNSLREYLQAKLPEYMVPALFVQLHEFELDFNGKIDRRALTAISTQTMRRDEAYVAPRTPQEKFLAELWADILRVERVGIHDNFFRLGGHSLSITQVIARIREALSLELPVQAMFEQPTIAALAKKLQDAGGINDGFAPPRITRSSRKEPLPLSFAQQRLWFLDQIEPGSRVHHIPTLLRLKGSLNIEVLSAALDEIVRRHEILRTSFPAVDGYPYQKISPPAHVPIEKVDLRDVPQEFREEKLRRLADAHIQKPFDLTHGPMFRVALYVTEEQEHVLCLTVHHIICDAWSVPILIRELNVLYSTFLDHGTSPLPELPLQYADVAAWERAWLRDEVLERHVQYWRQTLEGAPQSLELPTDFPRPSVRSLDAGRSTLCLSPQLYSELTKLSQQLGATEFMTLLALMNVWLFRYSGQSDILIGSPVSNRTQLETEGLIGIFLNTVVFRTRFDAQLRFTQLVDQVRLNAVATYAHQALPFEKLVEELQVVRDPGKNPVFQVMFNMLAKINDKLEFAGLVNSKAIETDAGQARFDLHLNAFPTDAGLELALTYNGGLFQQSTITGMLETFAELVRVIVENPELTISELLEKAMRFEQESELARKRGQSQQQGQQLRTVRRRAALNESR
ncbi:MAG: amino acid adenylation domain-containing protein [Acidobacteriia bacterium]|nr:amino acid adenylation domain-containing protein [Terriglobia bacterium]